MNLLKTKLRNRLSTKTVRALLTVRSGLKRLGKKASTYDFPGDVIKLIGTNEIYKKHKPMPEETNQSSQTQTQESDEDDLEEDYSCI